MLNRDDLEYYWERAKDADSDLKKDPTNHELYNAFKSQIEMTKSVYEGFITEGNELDEELQKRLNLINETLKKMKEYEAKVAAKTAESKRSLPSERAVNLSMYPTKKQTEEDGSTIYYFQLKGRNTSITGYWNSQSYIVMDFAAKLILENEDRLKNNPIELPNNEGMPCKYWINFSNREFKEATGKQWMQGRDIYKLISEAGETRVKNLRYGIIEKDEKGKSHYKAIILEGNFFTYGRNSTDEEHYLFFDSILGHAFVENVLKKMNDFIQISLYGLSNLTQILYRKFILTSASQKIRIKVDSIIRGLDLTDKDRNHQLKSIQRIFDELLRNHLISSYEPKEVTSLTKKFEVVRCDIKGQKMRQIEDKGK